MSLKKQVSFYLEDVSTGIGLTINLLILALIFLSLGIYVAQTYPLPVKIQFWLHQIDIFILIFFTSEYIVRFWCAENRLKFVFDVFSLIDILSILPLFLGLFDIRYFRIFRWFRILRIIRFFGSGISIFKVQQSDQIVFARILLTLFSIIFVYSGLIYQVEHPIKNTNFKTFLDAFYFAVVTMTTVGFGDVTPLSDTGRLITVLMILTGVLLIPWQIGDLTRQLLKTSNQVEIECQTCGLLNHDSDASFCKICGAELLKNPP